MHNLCQSIDVIIERHHSVAASANFHEGAVHRDVRQPSRKAGMSSETVEVREGVLEAFLNCIFCVLAIARDAQSHTVYPSGVPFEQITECSRMPQPSCNHEHGFLGIQAKPCA